MGPLCRLFFLFFPHGNVSLKFLFVRKPEKLGGKRGRTGQNGGRGDFFAVPKCALQPQYGCRYQDARVNFYCICYFFSALKRGHDCILQYV